MPTELRSKTKREGMKKVRSGETEANNRYDFVESSDIMLPPGFRSRLYDLFGQIEREFEVLYADNVALQEKLDALNERIESSASTGVVGVKDDASDSLDSMQAWKQSVKKSGSQISQRLKLTYKSSTSKIVSSFKNSTFGLQAVKEFCGHRDGVWEVSVANWPDAQIIATASADHTARVWHVETATCVMQYAGHSGSVNSVRFHPSLDNVVTASGDQKVHIWKVPVNLQHLETLKSHSSCEDESEIPDKEEPEGTSSPEEKHESVSIRQPLMELIGHSAVVIAADWLLGGSQVITASWDRTANIYDAETGALVSTLTGHDQELTNVCGHGAQKLIMTSSKDTTFRLWDFRDPSMKVNVFQGHTQQVTTAVFAGGDSLVSGSDDRTVKVWDLKNMRSPITTIRSDSPVNRLSVSAVHGLIAIPQDNRHIHLYDMNGIRCGRQTKMNKGHTRMVCSTAWNERDSVLCTFFSCGFDRQVLGWTMGQQLEK